MRLKDYDYSQNGAYFVTICTHKKANLLADVDIVGADLRVRPNIAGQMVLQKLNMLEISHRCKKNINVPTILYFNY